MNHGFIEVGTFQYSAEALIIKGKLEAEGIEVFIFDSHTIDVDPLVSNAIGGVKLKVKSEQHEQAVDILRSIDNYSVDNSGNLLRCPKCSGQRIYYLTVINDIKSLLAFCVTLIFSALPFFIRYKYTCQDCNHKFDIQ